MNRKLASSMTAASLALVTALAAACSADEPMAGNTPAREDATGVPTLAELDAVLALDAGDETVVSTALAAWSSAPENAARPFAGQRYREMEFVAAVAPALDDDQLGKLVQVVAARQDTRREEMRDRHRAMTAEQRAERKALREQRTEQRQERRKAHAAARAEHRAAWLTATLELTAEQATGVNTAMSEMKNEMASIHSARRSGLLTREQVRERMHAAQRTFDESLQTIVTPEQGARVAILEPLFPGRRHAR